MKDLGNFFDKVSKKMFASNDVDVWCFYEDGENIVNITEHSSEENQCATANYRVDVISFKTYEFHLVDSWVDEELPLVIKGEIEFRNFIKKLDSKKYRDLKQ